MKRLTGLIPLLYFIPLQLLSQTGNINQGDSSIQAKDSTNRNLQIQQITITGSKQPAGVQHNDNGSISIDRTGINSLPAILGENDPVKALQMLAGVQNGSEGATGIFVRGGGPDQTLVLLDGTPVYNPAHLDGFLSVFNTDAVEQINLYKDLFPAEYFNRLSAVVDVKMGEGDTSRISGSFSVGFLTSRFHLEGPLTKNKKATFSLSSRGCYAGLFTAPISEAAFNANGTPGSLWYYFADVNAKIVYHFSTNDRFEFNFFSNNDFYRFHQNSSDSNTAFSDHNYVEQSYKWSNYVASAGLLQTLNEHWKLTYHFSFSRYNLSSTEKNNYAETFANSGSNNFYDDYYFNTNVWLDDLSGYSEAAYQTSKNMFKTGAGLTGMLFRTGGGTFDLDNTESGNLYYQLNGELQQSLAAFIYAEDEFHPTRRWVITGQLRGETYTIGSKTFPELLPGLSVVYNPAGKLYLRAVGCGVSQNMHLLTNSSSNVLSDFWVPATADAKPETGWNFSGGLTQKLPLNFEWSADGFYRLMNNLVDYTQAAPDYAIYEQWQSQVTTGGKGKSYGAEFYLGRNAGIITGSVAYTLAWSERQFASLNSGNWFPDKYDRRHNITAQLAGKIGKHIEVGADFVYASGDMVTFPTLTYVCCGSNISYFDALQNNSPTPGTAVISVYAGRNNYRLPSYQHLDISFTWHKQAGKLVHLFNLSVYNIYNHFNQFDIYPEIQTDADGTRSVMYKQVSLLPITPSATYTIKF